MVSARQLVLREIFFFFQAEDGIRDVAVTGVQTCALPICEGLLLEVSGQRLSLHAESKEIIFPPGAGGLPTIKIGVLYKGRLEGNAAVDGRQTLHYQDRNFPGRAGWKEIIAVPESSVRLLSSTAPEADRSSRLSNYPTDLLNSPPQDLEARVVFALEPESRLVAGGGFFPSGSSPCRTKKRAARAAAPNKKKAP